jgi:hypothetical protein
MNYDSPAAQERVRDAAYDAIEKVLDGMFVPLGRQALSARWKTACEAMAQYLEAQGNRDE